MDIRKPEFSDSETRIDRNYRAQVDSGRWLDYPMIVSIETYAKCNAACEFCPYVEMERIGAKLSRERVFSLLDEVARYPVPPQRLNLCRVNEPFLDPNLFDYLEYAAEHLPHTDLILFSNGQTLTDKVIDRLASLPTFRQLTISFNEHDADEYRRVMGINFKQTVKRISRMHERFDAGSIPFRVLISRVGSSNSTDAEFLQWCRERFPKFPASSAARFDWIGSAQTNQAIAPDAGCMQWFSLHVLADGQFAFCCIDGAGDAMQESLADKSMLDAYNAPSKRNLRAQIVSRRDVSICANCIHAMPSSAYALHETETTA